MVIEASALVDALVGEPANPDVLAIITTEELHAPSLLDFELASALRGFVLGSKLTSTAMAAAVEDFAGLQLWRHPMTGLLQEIVDLRDRFTAYDAAYVVLARRLEATLLTADAKLQEAMRLGVDVRLVRPPK